MCPSTHYAHGLKYPWFEFISLKCWIISNWIYFWPTTSKSTVTLCAVCCLVRCGILDMPFVALECTIKPPSYADINYVINELLSRHLSTSFVSLRYPIFIPHAFLMGHTIYICFTSSIPSITLFRSLDARVCVCVCVCIRWYDTWKSLLYARIGNEGARRRNDKISW